MLRNVQILSLVWFSLNLTIAELSYKTSGFALEILPSVYINGAPYISQTEVLALIKHHVEDRLLFLFYSEVLLVISFWHVVVWN